ncbi:MAG: DUF4389 domain-containing protein [Thermomicrobiales bacterium]
MSRWKIFVKWLLAIPHYIVLGIFSIMVSIIVWIVWFISSLHQALSGSLFKLVMTYMRWTANVNAYVMLSWTSTLHSEKDHTRFGSICRTRQCLSLAHLHPSGCW